MKKFFAAAALAVAFSAPAAAVVTTSSGSASDMATALAGSGINITGSSLTTSSENGFFSGGSAALGIDSGVVLTTGALSCIGSGPNGNSCTGPGTGSSLTLTFTSDASTLFFNYVFASEEYNEYVNSNFNDTFQLLLNGIGFTNVNLAQVPGNGGAVTINNVNNGSNSAYYRDNTVLGLPIGYDGLTTVLTAQATGLTIGSTYTLSFNVADVGDAAYDSAVFIQGGTVGNEETPVPEPAMLGLFGLGVAGLGLMRRRKA